MFPLIFWQPLCVLDKIIRFSKVFCAIILFLSKKSIFPVTSNDKSCLPKIDALFLQQLERQTSYLKHSAKIPIGMCASALFPRALTYLHTQISAEKIGYLTRPVIQISTSNKSKFSASSHPKLTDN
ncbi:hypothetical protein ACHAWX_006840 [Stephanocyclus meneghinianus]